MNVIFPLLLTLFLVADVKPPPLQYVKGSTKKIAQLTGEFDKERGKPTLSQTQSRFGVDATDLGSSFEHDGKLYFLFGDTWGKPGFLDAVAWTNSKIPDAIRLEFFKDADGKWKPPIVPGIEQGGFDIPSGGVSVGGKIYVVFTTDWNPEKGNMGRSVLAESSDDGKTFQRLYDISTTKFINVSIVEKDGWLYVYGSGAYRKSSPYLARIAPKNIGDKTKWEYFGGLDAGGKPAWKSNETDAAKLFDHDVIGEFSVAYCQPVKRWVMLYNSSNPRGIVMRSSETPWGNWSDASVIFDPWLDGGYGHFMHVSAGFQSATHDAVNDPGRDSEWGGEYGPYLMARYTKSVKGGCRIFYTMSTWNPYQVVVMQTDLTAARN